MRAKPTIREEKNPLFSRCKACSCCEEEKEDIKILNICNNILRLCKECRDQLKELL